VGRAAEAAKERQSRFVVLRLKSAEPRRSNEPFRKAKLSIVDYIR
jgi:hypothetical protein